jgi:hypothetical protein
MRRPILHHRIAALSACALQLTALIATSAAADETIDAPSRQHREQIERANGAKDRAEQEPRFNIQTLESQTAPGGNTSSASSSVITNSDGTATVTIEVNGKKETRSFKLGEEPFSLKLKDAPKLNIQVKGGKETWIGVAAGSGVPDEVRAQLPINVGEGISVSHVAPESPAAKAGLAQHDILVRFDDQILVDAEQFKKLVKMHKPGDSVKLAYFRKGERHEVPVTLEEHEAELEARDALKMIGELDKDVKGGSIESLRDRLLNYRDKSDTIRERLKEAKEKFPGIVVDKQSFVLGVDGTVKKLEGQLQNVEGMVKTLREQLEKADIPKEKVEEVRKALEEAIDKVGDAARKAAIDAIRDYRVKRETEKNALQPPKPDAPAQPAPPAPPIKPQP